MSTRRRIAITALSALLLAGTVLGGDWSVRSEGWAIATLVGYGIALVGAFFVDRWWALLPAASTVAIGWLGSLIYQPPHPWSEETLILPVYAWIVVVALEVVVPAAFISLGLLARRVWDHFRREDRGAGTPTLSEVER